MSDFSAAVRMLTREEADEYLDARRFERRLTLRAGFHPEALRELGEAIQWYDKGGQGRECTVPR